MYTHPSNYRVLNIKNKGEAHKIIEKKYEYCWSDLLITKPYKYVYASFCTKNTYGAAFNYMDNVNCTKTYIRNHIKMGLCTYENREPYWYGRW